MQHVHVQKGEAMKATISFELVDKKIGDEDVAGLVSLDADSKNDDLRKKIIQMIESIADPKIVVGFADPNDILFFTDCDWVCGGVYDGKVLVASEPISEENFDGNIW